MEKDLERLSNRLGFFCRIYTVCRGGSRTAATSKMEYFVIIVNGFQPLTITTKSSILDVAAVLGLPLDSVPQVIVCLLI